MVAWTVFGSVCSAIGVVLAILFYIYPNNKKNK